MIPAPGIIRCQWEDFRSELSNLMSLSRTPLGTVAVVVELHDHEEPPLLRSPAVCCVTVANFTCKVPVAQVVLENMPGAGVWQFKENHVHVFHANSFFCVRA